MKHGEGLRINFKIFMLSLLILYRYGDSLCLAGVPVGLHSGRFEDKLFLTNLGNFFFFYSAATITVKTLSSVTGQIIMNESNNKIDISAALALTNGKKSKQIKARRT